MKLKTFNPETTPNQRLAGKVAAVNLYFRSGIFSINQTACSMLELSSGDQVMLHQDEDAPEDWYIEKVSDGGYKTRSKSGEPYPIAFNNTALIREMVNSVEMEEGTTSCRIKIATEATESDGKKLYGIIMTSAECKVKAEAPE